MPELMWYDNLFVLYYIQAKLVQKVKHVEDKNYYTLQ